MKREKLLDACQFGEFVRELELAFLNELVETELVIEVRAVPATRYESGEGCIAAWNHETLLSDEDFSAMVERARDRAEDLVEQMLNP